MDKAKVLVLGSDYGTVEIVKALRKNGYYSIVADYYETTPTKKLADESWTISTTAIDEIELKCKENNVAAIITGAADFNIKNSRELCKRLNLPVYCSNDFAYEVSTNKYLFKKICKEVDAPIATDYHLNDDLRDEDIEKIKFPVVVKPVDKSGNKGMSYCSNKEQLIIAYKKARESSDNAQIIVERQLHGPEFAVNYVIANGEPRLFFFSSEHHQPDKPANLYSVIITTTHHLNQYISQVNEKVIDVFKHAGLTEGVAWVECMLDDDGKFYLLEMGYRFGGEVVNIPYKDVSGFDSIDWVIECALGKEHNSCDLPKAEYNYSSVAVSYLLFAEKDGVIGKIEGLEQIANIPGVLVDVPKQIGQKANKYATMGVIRFAAKDAREACEIIQKVNSLLKIESVDGDNLVIYFDDFKGVISEYEKANGKL